MIDERIDKLLNSWFQGVQEGTVLNSQSLVARRVFLKDPQISLEAAKVLTSDFHKAWKRKCEAWLDVPRGRLAQIILFDQGSRHIFPDTVKAYENDLRALELSLLMIKDRQDEKLSLLERQFIYLPMMHSESLKIQERSLKSYEMIFIEAPKKDKKNVEYFQFVYDMAKRMFQIIEEFQRFPQRNAALNRRSTPQEMEYLKDPNNAALMT